MLINHCILRKAETHLNEAIEVKILHRLMMQVILSVFKMHA